MLKYYANNTCYYKNLVAVHVKCCMFKSYCFTMYCPSVWYDSTVTAMRKLKIASNNGLRRLINLLKYNSASEMFVHLNILSFNEPLGKFVFSFKMRIMISDNFLVNDIVINCYTVI